MSKLGQPLTTTYEDSGFDAYMNRPFEGLGQASREWQEQTGYSYDDLSGHMENGNIHASAFTTTIAFTSTDYRTVTWAAGTISYQDGLVTPEIATSNTGSMTSRTYIYYDPQASKVALQTTTTAVTATKGERILLAIAVNNSNTSGMAEVQTFGATGVYVANLSAEHITSGSIRSKTVTLAVDAGEGDSYFNAGKTDYTNTDSGFILGLDDSDSDKAKFYIGSSTKYLNWDGSALVVQGVIKDGSGTDLVDATGLVSTANFPVEEIFISEDTPISTNSTTYADISGSSLTEFTITRTTKITFFVSALMWIDTNPGGLFIKLYVDGTETDTSAVILYENDSFPAYSLSKQKTYSLSAGTYTPKLQWKVNAANVDGFAQDIIFTRIQFGN